MEEESIKILKTICLITNMEEKSIEILKTICLITNIEEYQKIYNHA